MDRGALSDEVTFEPRPQWSDRVNQELLQITGKTASTKTPSGVSRACVRSCKKPALSAGLSLSGQAERRGAGWGMGWERSSGRSTRGLVGHCDYFGFRSK